MEFELKLEIPAASLPQLEAALREGGASRQRLQAHYFDTEGGALASHGLVLRLRKEGRRWVQTAKGPASGPLYRLEHNVALGRPPGAAMPVADLGRHAGTPVGERIRQALALTPGAALPALIPLYQTDVQRLKRSVVVEGSVLELALDLGRVVCGPQSLPLCELEVELKQGQPKHAVQLARDWCASHGLWLSVISKSMKGQRLGSGSPFGPAVAATRPEFGRRASSAQISEAVLQSCLAQVLANASEVAGGSLEAEPIHQLRVGLRRLRTAMRELQVPVDGLDPAWEAPLVAAFRDLGRHRDQHHVLPELQRQLAAAGGPALAMDSVGLASPDPGAVVRAPRLQDALLGLIGLVHGAAPGKDDAGHKKAKKVLRLRLEKLRAQLSQDGRNFLALDAGQQHRLRKRLKRLRYLSEFAAPLFAAGRLKAFVAGLKPLQDALGQYQDELRALQVLGRLSGAEPMAWFGVGWLTARRAPNARACQQALKAFARLKPFWH